MSGDTIRVAVCGAAGRMGRETIRAVAEADGMEVVTAIGRRETRRDAGTLAGTAPLGVVIESDLEAALTRTKPDVMVDFTLPGQVMENLAVAVALGIAPVIGTTGLSAEQFDALNKAARLKNIGAFFAPNFAVGAVLMMQFAAQAAQYLPDVEIIELHHEKKLDSPSGTALLTAQKIADARKAAPVAAPVNTVEKIAGARGADYEGIAIHSIRLPGYVAHQEVIFGGLGQTLTIRHDSLDRRSFMPGVVLAIRKVRDWNGLVIGLEKLLFPAQ